MNRLSNDTINAALRDLRVTIRDGQTNVYHRTPDNFQTVVAAALGKNTFQSPEEFFTSDHFNPQTLRRFDKLFAVPKTDTGRYPSLDDTAWAVQNFINRRCDPWAHVRASDLTPPVEIQVVA